MIIQHVETARIRLMLSMIKDRHLCMHMHSVDFFSHSRKYCKCMEHACTAYCDFPTEILIQVTNYLQFKLLRSRKMNNICPTGIFYRMFGPLRRMLRFIESGQESELPGRHEV
jgi:hypothetical protein